MKKEISIVCFAIFLMLFLPVTTLADKIEKIIILGESGEDDGCYVQVCEKENNMIAINIKYIHQPAGSKLFLYSGISKKIIDTAQVKNDEINFNISNIGRVEKISTVEYLTVKNLSGENLHFSENSPWICHNESEPSIGIVMLAHFMPMSVNGLKKGILSPGKHPEL